MTELGTSSLGVSTFGETGARFAHDIQFVATFDVTDTQIRATFDVDERDLRGRVIDRDLDE